MLADLSWISDPLPMAGSMDAWRERSRLMLAEKQEKQSCGGTKRRSDGNGIQTATAIIGSIGPVSVAACGC